MNPDSGAFARGSKLERGHLAVFLAVTFGVSWTTAGVIYLLGGLGAGPVLPLGIPLWLVLLAGPYMWGPAIGHLTVLWHSGEGFDQEDLPLHVPDRPRIWVVSWLGPVVLVLAGAALYFLLFPDRFGGLDAVADLLRAVERRTGSPIPLSPLAFVAVQFLQVLLAAPILNAVSAFGEEFGWRGYLLPALSPLGWRPALLLHGIVWGVWHWPVVAMGWNYGQAYPGAPWAGFGTIVLTLVPIGVCFGWLTRRSGSVWPATLAHAMLNGSAGLAVLFASTVPNAIWGPTPVGLVGSVPWFIAVAVLIWLPTGEDRFSKGSPTS
jgi:membrane protease YdiL (CAAX protease family)